MCLQCPHWDPTDIRSRCPASSSSVFHPPLACVGPKKQQKNKTKKWQRSAELRWTSDFFSKLGKKLTTTGMQRRMRFCAAAFASAVVGATTLERMDVDVQSRLVGEDGDWESKRYKHCQTFDSISGRLRLVLSTPLCSALVGEEGRGNHLLTSKRFYFHFCI